MTRLSVEGGGEGGREGGREDVPSSVPLERKHM